MDIAPPERPKKWRFQPRRAENLRSWWGLEVIQAWWGWGVPKGPTWEKLRGHGPVWEMFLDLQRSGQKVFFNKNRKFNRQWTLGSQNRRVETI